ncbi:hypothetical protein KSS93_23335 [Pseudomonas xanthosomatis]|uniref:hypothetical protein n=1 Tax=Pseudomonas xanthosomatis TaxID=2842356 RepID=UPI001C3DC6AA|nr:hypothetical protein [Pseudomonas xanthosomatis]QXH49006.1 hypothetical protein KSS93_23335 [Pseudomonas xanthosomatis]
MDFTPQRRWPRQLLVWLLILLAVALNFNPQDLPSFERPRRVFTRGFVMVCVVVVVIELILLNQLYS